MISEVISEVIEAMTLGTVSYVETKRLINTPSNIKQTSIGHRTSRTSKMELMHHD